MKFWWKGVLPTLIALMLAGELYAGGTWLMNQPQDWAMFGGATMLTSIVVVFGGWASWIQRSFFKEQK